MLTRKIFTIIVIYLLNEAVSQDFNITACQHSSLVLQCHPGQFVHVVNAKYGRDMNFKCGFGFNKNCNSHLALIKTRTLCEGREICSIPVDVKFFGDDPCPHTSKYLQVQYRCETDNRAKRCLANELKCDDGQCIDNVKVCDGFWDCSGGDDESRCNYRTFIGCSNMYIECNENEVIHILRGQYGRTSSTICQPDIGHYCSASNATSIIKDRCNMKRICYINGFKDVFGDPCPNTSKYIQVTYACTQFEFPPAKDNSSEEDASMT